MNSMDPQCLDALQELADRAERLHLPNTGDPRVERYRLVLRALAVAPAEQLPADFAASMQRRVLQMEDSFSVEDVLLSLLLLGAALTGLFYMKPVIATLISQWHLSLPSLPWPLLAATAVSVVLAWAIDRGAMKNWQRNGHG